MITRKSYLLTIQFILILVSGSILIQGCRKIDRQVEENTISETENKFFNEHRSDDPLVQAINIYFKTFNSKHQFVGKTVNQIGFPYWDKSITFAKTDENSVGRGNSEDSVSVTYIPFVRDSQQFVNASLLVRTTPSDTSFQYLCNWQYAEFGFDTTQTGWNARNVFHVFALLDKNVFGRTKFRITDENLLTEDQNSYLDSLGLSFDSVEVVFNFIQPSQKTTLGRGNLLMPVTGCNDVVGCVKTHMMAFRSGKGQIQPAPDICPPGETPMVFTICTDIWVYIPSGDNGSGGSGGGGSTGGGGGSGGGGIPPECGSTLPGRTNLTDPCEPGWEPVLLPPGTPYDPNNYDTIGVSNLLRTNFPCIASLIKDSLPNTNGFTQRILYNIFGISSRIHLDFDIDNSLTKDSVDAYNSPILFAIDTANNLFHYQSRIFLNPWVLENATYEYNVANLIHEPIHAFIDQIYYQYFNGIIDSAQVLAAFPIFWDFFTHPLTASNSYLPPTTHHNIMASTFIDSISSIIKHYYKGPAPSEQWKDSISKALAWGGLNTTNTWYSKQTSEKCRIAAINLAARDTSIRSVIPNIQGLSCNNFTTARYDSLKLSPPCQ